MFCYCSHISNPHYSHTKITSHVILQLLDSQIRRNVGPRKARRRCNSIDNEQLIHIYYGNTIIFVHSILDTSVSSTSESHGNKK